MKELDRIQEIVEDFASDRTFTRADFDELVMLTQSVSVSLPQRFVEIVNECDRNFPNVAITIGQKEISVFCERLHRVLEVSREFPVKVSNETDGVSALEPTFHLAGTDKERVFELCNQIRKIIFGSDIFDQPHKRLLLNRVAAIEYQVEQPKGKLDVLRAGVSEVGETLGKFGTDIEPLTKRIKEVFQIGRSNSDEYAQIPAPDEIKQLPAPEEEDE